MTNGLGSKSGCSFKESFYLQQMARKKVWIQVKSWSVALITGAARYT